VGDRTINPVMRVDERNTEAIGKKVGAKDRWLLFLENIIIGRKEEKTRRKNSGRREIEPFGRKSFKWGKGANQKL